MQGNSIDFINQNSRNKTSSNLKALAIQQLDGIIQAMPSPISQLIEEAYIHKRVPKEYLFSSILFAFSNAAGLAFKIECMNYTNFANLYFAIIGSRGDVKSPAMQIACSPLEKKDNENYKLYNKQINDVKNDTFIGAELEPVKRKQFLIQNATVEAAMFNHLQNPYSIGIYVDELSYLIEKMSNKNSNEGAVWRVFLLQGNTNKNIDVSRKTSESYRLEKSYPTLLGSIQNQFIPKMFSDGNLESGFIDRLLFTNILEGNHKISKEKISPGVIGNYENLLNGLLNYRGHMESASNDYTVMMDSDAESKIHNYSQGLLDAQQKLLDITKEYLSKMLITIHKLVLLVHLINTAQNNSFQSKISLETVNTAILINDFYLTNFKLVLENKNEDINPKILLKKIIALAKKNNATQSDVVAVSGYSKSQVSKVWNK